MIKPTIIALLGVLPLLPLNKGSEWTETRNKNDITTYIGTPNETGLRPTRSVMIVNETPDEVLKAILDFDSYHHWVPYCENSHTVEQPSDSLYYFYQLLDMPLIKNRDIIIKVLIEETDNGGYDLDMVAVPEHIDVDPDAVRITVFTAEYSIHKNENTGKTMVEMENEVDPGGFIPTFALNWASRSQPHETFSNLKAHISKYGSD